MYVRVDGYYCTFPFLTTVTVMQSNASRKLVMQSEYLDYRLRFYGRARFLSCQRSFLELKGFGLSRTVLSVSVERRVAGKNRCGKCSLQIDARDPTILTFKGRSQRNLCALRSTRGIDLLQTSMKGVSKSRCNRALEKDKEEACLDNKRCEITEMKPRKSGLYKFFGVEMNPDTVAIATVYFVQGILGISRLAVSFYLKDDLHLDPAEMKRFLECSFIPKFWGAPHYCTALAVLAACLLAYVTTALFTGFSAVPWLIKPLYGFVSDGLPLFGYRRRSYLALCGFLGTASWGALATLVDNKYTAVVVILLSSLSVAFSDVVVDSMVVERARGESQSTSGSLQSLCWGSSAVGGILSAYLSGYFVETYGVRFVFGITALLPLITSATAVLVGYLWLTVKEPSILLPTFFMFLWQATPTSETAMFFFTTNKLGFGPEFLGRVRLVTSIASLLGVGLYNQLLKDVPLWKMFLWTTCLGSILGFTQLMLVSGWNRELGISDEWFAMGDSLVLTVLGQVSFMPVLVLAAKLCPPGVEATLFATLMSVSNGGGVTGGIIGALLSRMLGVTSENFDNLALLVVLCNLSSLLPLPFLRLLPSDGDIVATVEKAERALSKSSKRD